MSRIRPFSDDKLIKTVFKENHGNLELSAMISRFGGLFVGVYNVDTWGMPFSCNNIIEARQWILDNKEAQNDKT